MKLTILFQIYIGYNWTTQILSINGDQPELTSDQISKIHELVVESIYFNNHGESKVIRWKTAENVDKLFQNISIIYPSLSSSKSLVTTEVNKYFNDLSARLRDTINSLNYSICVRNILTNVSIDANECTFLKMDDPRMDIKDKIVDDCSHNHSDPYIRKLELYLIESSVADYLALHAIALLLGEPSNDLKAYVQASTTWFYDTIFSNKSILTDGQINMLFKRILNSKEIKIHIPWALNDKIPEYHIIDCLIRKYSREIADINSGNSTKETLASTVIPTRENLDQGQSKRILFVIMIAIWILIASIITIILLKAYKKRKIRLKQIP